MTRLLKLTPRQILIVLHDVAATAAALVLTFYVRFEDLQFDQRMPDLKYLPFFLIYAAAVYFIFGMHRNKWRFTSVPDLFNIIRAVTVLALSLLVLDYILLSPNVYGHFFFGKITVLLYWFLQMFFLGGSRMAYRYFHDARTRQRVKVIDATPALVLGRAADTEVLLRSIESGAVKKIWPAGILSPSAADRGQSIRGIPVLGDIDDLERVVADFNSRGTRITRIILTPSALSPEARPEVLLIRARFRRECRWRQDDARDPRATAVEIGHHTLEVFDIAQHRNASDRLAAIGRGWRQNSGRPYLFYRAAFDRAQQHFGIGGAAEHQSRRRVDNLHALTRARIVEIAIRDPRAAQKEHLQEPIEQDGDLAEEEMAVDVGREQNVVEHEQRQRQNGDGADYIEEIGDRSEPPLVAVHAENKINRRSINQKNRQVLEVGQALIELQILEANIKRQHERRGRGGDIVQHDQYLARREFQQPCHLDGFPVSLRRIIA